MNVNDYVIADTLFGSPVARMQLDHFLHVVRNPLSLFQRPQRTQEAITTKGKNLASGKHLKILCV